MSDNCRGVNSLDSSLKAKITSKDWRYKAKARTQDWTFKTKGLRFGP